MELDISKYLTIHKGFGVERTEDMRNNCVEEMLLHGAIFSKRVLDSGKYEEVEHFIFGYAGVKKNNLWAFVNKNEQEICDFIYQLVGYFTPDELVAVKRNNLWGFMDKYGREISEIKYVGVGDFHNGYAVVKEGKKYGYINRYGKEITKIEFDFANSFQHGKGLVIMNGKRGVVNSRGDIQVELFGVGRNFSLQTK